MSAAYDNRMKTGARPGGSRGNLSWGEAQNRAITNRHLSKYERDKFNNMARETLIRFIGAFPGVSDDKISNRVHIKSQIRADALRSLIEDGLVVVSFTTRKNGHGHKRCYYLAEAQ